MNLYFKSRKLFGQTMLDPVCDKAKHLIAFMARIKHRKSLMMHEVDDLEVLGLNIIIDDTNVTPEQH